MLHRSLPRTGLVLMTVLFISVAVIQTTHASSSSSSSSAASLSRRQQQQPAPQRSTTSRNPPHHEEIIIRLRRFLNSKDHHDGKKPTASLSSHDQLKGATVAQRADSSSASGTEKRHKTDSERGWPTWFPRSDSDQKMKEQDSVLESAAKQAKGTTARITWQVIEQQTARPRHWKSRKLTTLQLIQQNHIRVLHSNSNSGTTTTMTIILSMKENQSPRELFLMP